METNLAPRAGRRKADITSAYSMTSSARSRIDGGTVRPSARGPALAVHHHDLAIPFGFRIAMTTSPGRPIVCNISVDCRDRVRRAQHGHVVDAREHAHRNRRSDCNLILIR